jgi:hypothetical protein
MPRMGARGWQCQGEILRVKAAVRERDDYACTRCGMGHEEHIAIYGKTFDVHRLTPGSFYTLEGCVTICRACHGPEPKRKKGEPDLANGPRFRIVLDPETAAALDAFMRSLTVPVPVHRVTAKALREFLVSRGFRKPG